MQNKRGKPGYDINSLFSRQQKKKKEGETGFITRYYLRAEILQNLEFLTNITPTCNQSKQMGPPQRRYLLKRLSA